MLTYPKTSRAAVIRDFRAPIRIEEVPVPQDIEPGAILARICACSICGTDVHLWQGSLALKVDLPVILGHEMVGEIVALGAGAGRDSVGQDLKVGDRITWTHGTCGKCYFCTVAREPTLCAHTRMYMYSRMDRYPYLLGGFSEFGYVLPESGRIKVPDNVSNDLASMASCAFRSVMNAFSNLGEIRPGETAVIQGTGPLGLLAVAVAKVAGAKVIAIGAPEARLSLAADFGADETLSIDTTTHEERLDRIRALTEGRGADIVMEFTGHPPAFAQGLEIARRGGRYVVVGTLGQFEATIKPSLIVSKNLTIKGSFSGQTRDYWRALEFVSRHQHTIPFHRMISNRFSLDQVNEAMGRMQAYAEIKPVIDLTR